MKHFCNIKTFILNDPKNSITLAIEHDKYINVKLFIFNMIRGLLFSSKTVGNVISITVIFTTRSYIK